VVYIQDRFHIVAHQNKAIHQFRAAEAKELARLLKNMCWLLVKHLQNLTAAHDLSLRQLLAYNLRTVRGYLLKEEFQLFWKYSSAFWAGRFLDRWCTRAMRSRIDPMKKVARMLRGHREPIPNWFRANKMFSSGIVDHLNAKATVTTRNAYGCRTFNTFELALYHDLGASCEGPRKSAGSGEPELRHTWPIRR